MEARQPTNTINSSANNINNKEEEDDDEEFYEKMEAPKFVDFNNSDDPFRIDDRYWFCLRVGCDSKHEEELDHEEISKNFILRVMAARSPNIRFRKALNGRNTSTNVKCPQSAPAKSSKSRVSRLAMVTSVSQKKLEFNGKVRTPRAKTRQVASKYMTTPRNKKSLPKMNSFQSVPNPRLSNVQVHKSHRVVKGLVFHSPKTAVTLKSSVELCSPVTKLRNDMKRIEIASQMKRILGYSCKSLKDARRIHQKTSSVNPPRRQQSAKKDECRVMDLLPCHSSVNDQEAKSQRNVKSKSKQMLHKCDCMPKEILKIDACELEIDIKMKDSPRVIQVEAHDEELLNSKSADSRDCEDAVVVSDVPPSTENCEAFNYKAGGDERNSLTNLALKKNLEGMDIPRSHPLNEEGVEGIEGIESNTKLSSDNVKSHNDEQILEVVELVITVTDSEDENRHSSKGREADDDTKLYPENKESCTKHQTLQTIEHETEEVMDSDDKENAQVSDENRHYSHNNHKSERGIPSRQEEAHSHKNEKVVRTCDKNTTATSVVTGAPNVKHRKPKPTNPKPFRLRTDERQILKETNMERKNPVAQKEAVTVPRCSSGKSHRRHGNDITGNEKCAKLIRNDECIESKEKVQQNETRKNRFVGLASSGPQHGQKLSLITPQRCLRPLKPAADSTASQDEHGKDNMSQKSETNTRKRTILQSKLVRPQGPERSLSAIKETSATTKSSETRKLYKKATSGSLLHGKRPVNIPNEPNLHSANVPKSCTRKTA